MVNVVGVHLFHGDGGSGRLLQVDLRQALHQLLALVGADDGIAQGHDERLGAHEFLGMEDGVAQAARHGLAGVEEANGKLLKGQLLQQGAVSAGSQIGREGLVAIKVVLNGPLAPAGHQTDIAGGGALQLLNHVLHHGLAADGQHFLGLRLGSRQQPGAESATGITALRTALLDAGIIDSSRGFGCSQPVVVSPVVEQFGPDDHVLHLVGALVDLRMRTSRYITGDSL